MRAARRQLLSDNSLYTKMSVQVTPEQMAALRATLLKTSGKTELHERFRALFMLKAVGGDEVIQIIAEGESCGVPQLASTTTTTEHQR